MSIGGLAEPGARRTILWLTAVFLAAAVCRTVLAECIESPRIFDDELRYVELARSVPKGRGLLWGELPSGFPCYLYPLLLAPLTAWLPMEGAYAAMRALNALLMAAAAFPAYWLAREIAGRRRALAAAFLVALLPGAGYSAMILTESLFYPVFTLALWLVFRAVLAATPGRCLSAGLACALAFHVKPQGLILPVIVLIAVFLFEWSRRTQSIRDHGFFRAARALLFPIARHWLTAIGWLVGMVPRFLEVVLLEEGHQSVNLSGVLGLYFGTMIGRPGQDLRWGELGLSFAGYLGLWCLAVGLLPAWAVARETVRAVTKRGSLPLRLLVILTSVSTLLALLLAARHTLLNEDLWRAYERYFIFVLPGGLILFCARDEPPPAKQAFLARGVVAIATPLLAFVAARKLHWYLPSDSPSLSGFFLSFVAPWTPASIAFLLILAGSLALFVRAQNTFRVRYAAVATLFLVFNFGWYAAHATVVRKAVQVDMEAARLVARRLGPDEQLVVLVEGLKPTLFWGVAFWKSSRLTYISHQDYWFCERLEIGSDGIVRPGVAGKRSYLLAGERWEFSKPPVISVPGASLYFLGGDPLKLEKTESAR